SCPRATAVGVPFLKSENCQCPLPVPRGSEKCLNGSTVVKTAGMRRPAAVSLTRAWGTLRRAFLKTRNVPRLFLGRVRSIHFVTRRQESIGALPDFPASLVGR